MGLITENLEHYVYRKILKIEEMAKVQWCQMVRGTERASFTHINIFTI